MDGVKEPHSKRKSSAVDSNFKRKSTELNHVKCYNCGEKGHIANTYPANVTKPNMVCRDEQQLLVWCVRLPLCVGVAK